MIKEDYPHKGSFVDWTMEQLDHFDKEDEVLVISPGFNVSSYPNVYTNGPNGEIDIITTIDDLMLRGDVCKIKAVIMSRVFEHLSMRDVDWYLYNIFKILEFAGQLILAVPDMDFHLEWLQNELATSHPDHFILHKIHTSLFNEGKDTKDYHKIWTNEKMMRYLLLREGLFAISRLSRVTIDTKTEVSLEIVARRL